MTPTKRVRSRATAVARWAAITLSIAFQGNQLACGLGDQTLAEVDPAALPQQVSYTRYVQPRVDYYCTACHTHDGPLGAAGRTDLSNYDEVRHAFDRSMEQIVSKRMPPGGARRLTARDQAILERWKAQGFVR